MVVWDLATVHMLTCWQLFGAEHMRLDLGKALASFTLWPSECACLCWKRERLSLTPAASAPSSWKNVGMA